jgi:hypothetical protein
MNNEEYQAIRKFAVGLQTCINVRRNSYPTLLNKDAQDALDYVLSLIHLHLSIAEVELEHTAEDMERNYK